MKGKIIMTGITPGSTKPVTTGVDVQPQVNETKKPRKPRTSKANATAGAPAQDTFNGKGTPTKGAKVNQGLKNIGEKIKKIIDNPKFKASLEKLSNAYKKASASKAVRGAARAITTGFLIGTGAIIAGKLLTGHHHSHHEDRLMAYED